MRKENVGWEALARAILSEREISAAEALRQAEGTFTASAFVERTTGVDNVCERGAVLAAGGSLYARKHAGGGVTMALAWKPVRLDWRWQDG